MIKNLTGDVNPRWLTLDQARQYAPMSEQDYRKLIESGDIYGVKRGKQGRLYIDRFSVDEYFERDRAHIRKTVEELRGAFV